MNPPIPESVCEEEMQNLDSNEVIIEYMIDAYGNKIKKLKPLLIKFSSGMKIQNQHDASGYKYISAVEKVHAKCGKAFRNLTRVCSDSSSFLTICPATPY